MKPSPTFELEEGYWQQGITPIAGIDEVGMGALAGPVVAAAVIFSAQIHIAGIRDSKMLSAGQRSKISEIIKKKAVAWSIGSASVAEITEINIRRASHLAMRRAVDGLTTLPALLMIDGTPAQPHPTIPAVSFVDGDALSLSIAAASIVAKVFRDTFMTNLDRALPVYGFAHHKGYGSSFHLAALQQYGPSSHHRQTYAPVAAALQQRATD